MTIVILSSVHRPTFRVRGLMICCFSYYLDLSLSAIVPWFACFFCILCGTLNSLNSSPVMFVYIIDKNLIYFIRALKLIRKWPKSQNVKYLRGSVLTGDFCNFTEDNFNLHIKSDQSKNKKTTVLEAVIFFWGGRLIILHELFK